MTDPPVAPPVVEPRDVALRMRMDYSHGIIDPSMKTIEEVGSFCSKARLRKFELDAFLKDSVELISKLFGISNVSVALWDQKRAAYSYRAFAGFEKDTIDAYRSISYTKEHVTDEKTYPSHEVSRCTRIYLSEEHPYANGEEDSFARPALLGMKRRSLTDSLEGDYLCIFFHGADNEVIGWFEVSGTRLRKLPDTVTIKWIELLACVVGSVVTLRF